MTAALERTGLKPDQMGKIFLDRRRQSSDCSSTTRYAALLVGIPRTVPVSAVVCAYTSGMPAVNCDLDTIRTGQDQVVLTGSIESMSNAIFYLSNARWGVGTGTTQLRGSLTEAQFCPQSQGIYGRFNMGITTENITAKMGITREEQDRFVLVPREKTRVVIMAGHFKNEIMSLTISQGRKKPDKVFDADELPRETSLKLPFRLKSTLPPPDGIATAGNSSGRNDGASMLVLIDAQLAEEQELKPLIRILGVTSTSVNPRCMGLGPMPATQEALGMADLRLDDIQFVKLGEVSAT